MPVRKPPVAAARIDKQPSRSYVAGMSEYSIAEAKDGLPDQIDRALKGEAVVITRDGRPAVEIKPVVQSHAELRDPNVKWLRARLEGELPARTDAGTLVSQMRDDEWRR